MANFYKAYNKLIKYEGTYSNHSKDRGGETYKGISRYYFPDWSGWFIIDHFKEKYYDNFIDRLNTHEYLNKLVKDHYKSKFWNFFDGDNLLDQKVAEELFEMSVNIGRIRTVRIIQKSLNLLNRNQSLYPDLSVDGLFGPNTKSTLDKSLEIKKDRKFLFNLLNLYQGCRYIEIGNETFIRGWINRIKMRKK